MNKGTIAVVGFSVGAAAGYFAAKKTLEEKYAQLAQEEIDSVKERFRQERAEDDKDKKAPEQSKLTEEERENYIHYAKSLGYTQQDKPEPILSPHVISPDEFGELTEYERVSLAYYYEDHVLLNSSGHPMSSDEIEETVGEESLEHFGEYEDDSVFVRNDRLKVDYEILMDAGAYADTIEDNPY